MLTEHGVVSGGVHDLVQQPEAGHGVFGVKRGRAVTGSDFGARKAIGQSRATYQQWNVNSVLAQIATGDDHLVSAFDQQTRKANGIRVMMLTDGDQRFRRYLYAEVYHFVAVVAQDNFHQVLADVVDVAFNGGQNDFSSGTGVGLLHEFFQMVDGGLHGLGRYQ